MSAVQQGRRNRRAGRTRELDWMRLQKKNGWEAAFVPAMCVVEGCDHEGCIKQAFDVLLCRDGSIVLDEVKSTKTPWATFPPARRQALREAASRAGGRPRLVWWPYDRRGVRIFEAWEWPD